MHNRRPRSPIALVAAVAVSLLAIVAAPSAGLAATTNHVSMDSSYAYHPGTVTLASVGDKVEWKNAANSSQKHDVFSDLPGYFHSPGGSGGLTKGKHYTRTFTSAGSFGYVCEIHYVDHMKGTVVVPIGVGLVNGRFRITAASSASGGSWRHVVQVRKPGSSTFQTIGTTTAANVTFKPGQHGTFVFRAAVKNISSGKLSGWSPTVSRTW